jgi:hypothetical protein
VLGSNITATLATVNGSPGTCLNGVIVNAKGLVTGVPTALQKSTATNGYYFLANGFIEQWGQKSITGTASTSSSVSFPIAFPNSCLNVTVSDCNGASGTNLTWSAVISNTSTMTIYKTNASGTTSTASPLLCFWRAVGY